MASNDHLEARQAVIKLVESFAKTTPTSNDKNREENLRSSRERHDIAYAMTTALSRYIAR